jgi:hypothetical protein
MKTCLLFANNGEITEKEIKDKKFENQSILEFTDYVKYDKYVILHNTSSKKDPDVNKTIFYFTEDRFKGDIILVKIDENNNIKNLKMNDYFKKLTKNVRENFKNIQNVNDSDSDSDSDLSIYGKILLKEPFEY